MAFSAVQKIGKTVFVREVLASDPFATATAVNAAWKAAGQTGTISVTLVNKQRAALGLAGNLRGKTTRIVGSSAADQTAQNRKKHGPTVRGPGNGKMLPAGPHANGKVERRAKASGRAGILEELEVDIDRLLFKVMSLGGMPAIEDSLRQTRRLLYGKFY